MMKLWKKGNWKVKVTLKKLRGSQGVGENPKAKNISKKKVKHWYWSQKQPTVATKPLCHRNMAHLFGAKTWLATLWELHASQFSSCLFRWSEWVLGIRFEGCSLHCLQNRGHPIITLPPDTTRGPGRGKRWREKNWRESYLKGFMSSQQAHWLSRLYFTACGIRSRTEISHQAVNGCREWSS